MMAASSTFIVNTVGGTQSCKSWQGIEFTDAAMRQGPAEP